MLKMDLEYKKKILFVRLDGKLNSTTSYKVNNYLIPVIMKHRIKYLVYNFTLLEQLDDFGIESILSTKDAIEKNKGFICLCGNNKNIMKKVNKLKIDMTKNENEVFNLIEA